MAELINLRRARKAKTKADKEKTAEANRVLHGTPKALRNLAEARKDKADQALSSHKLEKDQDDNRSVGESQSDKKEDKK
jgi:hypothetical protein